LDWLPNCELIPGGLVRGPPVMIAGGGEQITLCAVARLADACNIVGGDIAEVGTSWRCYADICVKWWFLVCSVFFGSEREGRLGGVFVQIGRQSDTGGLEVMLRWRGLRKFARLSGGGDWIRTSNRVCVS
jgi:hypothetical protein